MNVTIKQLTYFREVARCGSFTDAANQLHTSQSNLSSSIRVLEELLGVRLINRTTKHFELTESGEAFLDVAERVLDDLENAVQKASALSKLERGVLSIAAPTLHVSSFLPEIVSQFNYKFPNIEIIIKEVRSTRLFDALRSREVELVLGTMNEDSEDIRVHRLFKDELIVLAHRDIDLPQECRWEHLLNTPLVSITSTSSVGHVIERAVWEHTEKSLQPLLTLETWVAVIAYTAALRAVSVVPRMVEHYLNSVHPGSVLKKHEIIPRIGRTISVANLAKHSLSPVARKFLDFLQKQAEKLPQ